MEWESFVVIETHLNATKKKIYIVRAFKNVKGLDESEGEDQMMITRIYSVTMEPRIE